MYDEDDEQEDGDIQETATAAATELPLPKEVAVTVMVRARDMQDAIVHLVGVQVTKLFEGKIGNVVESTVSALVEQIAREKILSAVEASLAEGWNITDEYGGVKGTATLKDRISKLLNTHDRYGSRERWIDELLKKEVEAHLKGELKAEMEAARVKFRAEVDGVLRAKLNESLRAALGLAAV